MPTGYTLITTLKKGEPRGTTQKVVNRAMDLSQMELIANLKKNSPFDEGNMQGGWFPLRYSMLNRLVRSPQKYTPFVNDGTGIYGPRGQKIRPKSKKGSKSKKALAFTYKGAKVVVRSVKGIRPRKFVERSINDTEKRSDEFVIRAAMEFKGLL